MKIPLCRWAEKQGVTCERARQFARKKRIPAEQVAGKYWMIDEDAPKPEKLKPGPKPERGTCIIHENE